MFTSMLNLQQKTEIILKRRAFFDLHFPPIEGADAFDALSNSCPSCGYLTLEQRSGFETCSFCFWVDDGQDDIDADEVMGGPNGHYSLTVHREEVFDWMTALKERKYEEEYPEFSIGRELIQLDQLMLASPIDKQAIPDQIAVLTECFEESRDSKNARSKNRDL
jgi:hypothetical protein